MTTGSRGDIWFKLLATEDVVAQNKMASVRVAKGSIGDENCWFLAVRPDPDNLYPRARNGEVGLLEGWGLAEAIEDIMSVAVDSTTKEPIVAIVDVPSQAYGRREEALGIHQALAGAVSAYARARLAGHPVIALLVGKAMSGGFLAHGYQANRIVALADPGVQVHAMGKSAAARITLRTEEELDHLAKKIPPMAYDMESYESLGMLDDLIRIGSVDSPGQDDINIVKQTVGKAIADIGKGDTGIARRLNGANRKASQRVRELMRAQWRD
ncbi:MAG: biotin-independent malonate decarboxylase subunit gamma [Marinobacter sp.]|nr:biotin-independent malonate decarboxylase subunit gamma [Marinobacter sp.]